MAHWDRRELNKLIAVSPEEYKKRFPEPFSAMIPEDASSENKLATEAYVNEHGGGGGSDPEAVKYVAQELSESQKAQALANIGGASAESVTAETARATAAEEDIMDAMDGTNVEVVTALPAASASTVGKFYYVGPDSNGEYARYRGIESGGSYSFLPVGTTEMNLSTYATKAEVGELEAKVDEFQYLQDASVLDFRPGYVSGSAGNPYSIVDSATRHYCILPANANLSQVILQNCTSYARIDIDASGNYIVSKTATNAISSNAKYVAFNFENADNTYQGVKILQNLSLAEQNRFHSEDYNCFVRYSTNQDKEYITGTGVFYSQFYRSIIRVKLTGFNKDNPHQLYNLTRNYGANHKYGIIIRELISGTWTIVFNASKASVETNGVQNGVNVVTWTSGDKSVTATIDYSLITEGIDVNIATVAYIFKPECFESIDALTTKVNTIQANALFKQMLGTSVVSNNLADPDAIQDGKFISNTGGVASDADWSLISVPVEAGKKYTFGGFYLGRGGYYRFQDSNGDLVSSGSYSDPNGTQTPCTVTAPTGAVALLFDIKTGSSPENPYTYLTVNLGETLLPYDEYKTAITSIDGEEVAGGTSASIENRVRALENDVADIQTELLNGIETIIADLPVSDGTDVSVGYAYIETGTGAVKVKMS